MPSFSRFGKVEADGVKSIYSDQISEPDEGKRVKTRPPLQPHPQTPLGVPSV